MSVTSLRDSPRLAIGDLAGRGSQRQIQTIMPSSCVLKDHMRADDTAYM